MDLLTARKRAGLSQSQLAELAGTHKSTLSAIEGGNQSLGERLAARLAPHVGAHAPELVVSNQMEVLKRSMDQGDKLGALEAMVAVLKTVKPYENHFDQDFKRRLNETANLVLKFGRGAFDHHFVDFDDFDEGRDAYGNRIRPLNRDEDQDFDYGEEYDDFDEGRDIYGNRVRSLEEEE